MKITSSKIENILVKKVLNKLQEKLKDTKWKVVLDPSKKGILLKISKDKEHKLIYEIFLMNGYFVVLIRKPDQKLLGKIQNNFQFKELARSTFELIWEHFKKEKKNFNQLGYLYENGPLDNRAFKRGGWSDGIVLFQTSKK